MYVRNCCLQSSSCKLLENIPDHMTPECLPSVVKLLDGCSICVGHPDEQYCKLAKSHKGVFKDSSGKAVKVTLDTTSFISSRRYYKETVRTTRCEILVSSGRCTHCNQPTRPTLRSLAKNAKSHASPDRRATTSASTWNWQYLSTLQRKQRARNCMGEVCCSNIFNALAINGIWVHFCCYSSI